MGCTSPQDAGVKGCDPPLQRVTCSGHESARLASAICFRRYVPSLLEHPARILRRQLAHLVERRQLVGRQLAPSVAAMLSSSCSSRFAPMMTLVTAGWCSSHASAICATLDAVRAAAIARIASMTSQARSSLHRREVEGRPAAAASALPSRDVLAAQQAAGERAPDHQAEPSLCSIGTSSRSRSRPAIV